MNMWQCILLGIALAFVYQVIKVRSAKKLQKELQKSFDEQLKNNDENK